MFFLTHSHSTKTRCIRSTDLVFRSRVIIIIFGIFNQGKTRGGFDITKVNYKICLEAHPTLAVIINKTSCKTELNRCTTTEIRWNQKDGRLHQSPEARLAQELRSIPVDWAVGLHRNRDEFTL